MESKIKLFVQQITETKQKNYRNKKEDVRDVAIASPVRPVTPSTMPVW